MPDPTPATTPPAGHQESAVPIARRLARRTAFFPLWFRRTPSEERMPMVRWFAPAQLASTAFKSLVSLFVGERSDRRIVQALASRRQAYYDYTIQYRDGSRGPQPMRDLPRDELWIDFVCDTGDGWNPTYAVAFAAAQPSLRVASERGRIDLPRADLLVFGGDEVYPTPSRAEYQRRLVMPYASAFGDEASAARPHVFALPGNHDWYDGLSTFTRLFCSDVGGRRFAGWWTRQHRSYFVLKLPQHWWLVGSDGQLQSDLDVPQIEHFREIADRHMQRGDKVILCLSEPVWIYAQKYRNVDRELDETDLVFLREEIFARRGIELKVYLAGDLHHYRRHEETPDSARGAQPVQKIVAGGGGAFLHPTHEDDFSVLVEDAVTDGARERRFVAQATYPDMKRSARLAWGNVLFLFKNPRFGIVPAISYLLTCWLVGSSVDGPVPSTPWQALLATLDAFSDHPGLALWTLGIVGLFLAFTDTHSRPYRVIGGLAHSAAHFAAMFYVGWGAQSLSDFVLPPHGFLQSLFAGIVIFAGGWAVGSIVMGLYLLISLNVFGRHSEEAFSGLRIEDYKHFLRLHIDRHGTLSIWPIKIERVPRQWRTRRATDATASRYVPEPPITPELIEPPIVVR